MPKRSAGVLAYKFDRTVLRVLLVHPGGPFWSNREQGAWSIPKGEYGPDEAAETAARREFEEETGQALTAPLSLLGECRQKSGKLVVAFAAAVDFETSCLHSNLVDLEWPPRSGSIQQFPEVDRADWFTVAEARQKITAGQLPFLDWLEKMLMSGVGP